MPFLPNEDAFTVGGGQPNRLAMGSLSSGDAQGIVSAMQPRNYGLGATVLGDLALGTVDLVDTIGTSIP